MPAAISKVLHAWNHEDPNDAKAEILEALGDISEFQVFGSQVLLAPYIRPAISRGGIIDPRGNAQKEDRWQGRTSLLLKLGPTAFDYGDDEKKERALKGFYGRWPSIGDWVFHDVRGIFQANLKMPGSKMRPAAKREWEGWPVRIIYGNEILGRVPKPETIVDA